MSLRMRVFLLLGGVVAGLVVAQFWMLHSLSRELSGEIGHVALAVGESVVTSLATEAAEAPIASAAEPKRPIVTERVLHVKEIDGQLRLVGERVDIGPAPAMDAAGKADERTIVLRMESPAASGFLHLSGPSWEQRIPIPRGGIGDALERFLRRMFLGTGALLVLGLVGAGVVAHRAASPLRALAAAAKDVGEGALGAQVDVPPRGEVGDAIVAFNRMSSRLAELDAQAAQLREREHLSEIGEIARGLAHGLRNPLNALGLIVGELGTADLPAQERVALAASARRQIQRLDASIRSFLALAATDGAPAVAGVDVLALAQDVALEALHDARGRVAVSVSEASESPTVDGVAAELRAVVQALVVNAVEASPDGARVTLRVTSREGGGAIVEVVDDGPGLPASVRERLFTPHVTTKSGGAGMGLYLARRIVLGRHGGSLRLEPREPHGVRAIVQLDAARRDSRG